MDAQTRKLIRDYGGTILIAIVVALLIRFFVIEAYRIPSAAMRPTLEPGDTIFVAKWPFGLRFPWSPDPLTAGRTPRRGEVVVFSSPETHRDYIKRVVGIAGDLVAVREGRVILNGKPIQDHAATGTFADPCGRESLPQGPSFEVCREKPLIDDFGPEAVPSDKVFVIGDFRTQTGMESRGDAKGADPRPASAASRTKDVTTARTKGWGMVPISSLKGKALWIWLSIEPVSTAMGREGGSGWFPHFRFDRMLRKVE